VSPASACDLRCDARPPPARASASRPEPGGRQQSDASDARVQGAP
jgi:hypothetical protein